jgi:hypothetical protein
VHTTTYKGKRVLIRTRSGKAFVGRFMEKHTTYIVIDVGGEQKCVTTKDLLSMSIYKHGKR